MVYEVEFCYNGTEYDFDLNAVTGEVVKSGQEPCDHNGHHSGGTTGGNGNNGNSGNNGNNGNSVGSTDIGADAAQSAALAEAEVYDSAAQTVTEYQYKINRTTGAVLEREVERESVHDDDHWFDD